MGAPNGNQYWKARSRHGRKPIWEDPQQMLEACEEYFQWCEDNPLWEVKVSQYQGEPVKMTVPKMRMTTVEGLSVFLGIGTSTWRDYASKDGFSVVVDYVNSVMDSQKLGGAAADLLNASIVSRYLGLVDRAETAHKGNVSITDMTEDQLDAKLQQLAEELAEPYQEEEG